MMKQQRLIGINTEFESLNYKDFEENSWSATISLLDYDAVIISTDYLVAHYKDNSTMYENKRLLSAYASKQIQDDFSVVREQLIEILEQGKNVFVLLGNNENCFIYTGKTEYSGTGKNARRTNIVTEFDMYSFLPIKLSATHIYGEKVEVCERRPYSDFFRKTKECFHYAAYFTTEVGETLLKIQKTSKVISSAVKYGKGQIVLLPLPYCEEDYTNVKYWKQYGKLYLDALSELNAQLSASIDEYVLPEWAEKFSILNEDSEQEKLKKDKDKLDKLLQKIKKQEATIQQIQRYKTLVTSSGNQLEETVKLVLSELSFDLIEAERGRSDVIAKWLEFDIVAEIKGVSKSAAEKHAAQLEKWVAQFIEENGHSPKPLLIVNGFCDIPVLSRTEDVFPHQMLKYCEARGHVLITTTQLLCLYIETKNTPSLLKERLEELLSTVGIYQRYQNIKDFLIPIDCGGEDNA